jgi:hypothetical protein
MRELQRVLAPGGRLYLSVPVGQERLEFDAHRVFDPATIIRQFPELILEEFSVVNDAGNFIERTDPAPFRDAWYACGLFIFERPGRR